MSELSRQNCSHNKQELSHGLISLPVLKVFPPCLPSTFVISVHDCRGPNRVQHTVLAQSLKWGSMRLPPLILAETKAFAKTVWCWLHVVGIRLRGEAQTLSKEYLFFYRAVRRSCSFAHRQVYLCWKESEECISFSSCDDKHPFVLV